MNTVNIVLAEDHQYASIGIKELLERNPIYRVLAICRDTGETIREIEVHHPDLVITDLNMPGEDPFTMIQLIKKRWPAIKIIALSMYHAPPLIRKAYEAGVDGYVSKEEGAGKLLNVLELVLHGPPK